MLLVRVVQNISIAGARINIAIGQLYPVNGIRPYALDHVPPVTQA